MIWPKIIPSICPSLIPGLPDTGRQHGYSRSRCRSRILLCESFLINWKPVERFTDIYDIQPIGNTPATCLTQALPLRKPANVLLLGCGDARSILYTLYADPSAKSRKFDFTCCDIEPAVLGKNANQQSIITRLS
jgi:hypothetical protein